MSGNYVTLETIYTPAEVALNALLAKLPSNAEVLAALKPSPVPRGTPSFDEAERMGLRVEKWDYKGWAVIDTRQEKSYCTRCKTKAEAKKAARAIAFAGAVYDWTEDNGKGLKGQRCVSGPDWAPYRRPDISLIHPLARRHLKKARKSDVTANAARVAGMITDAEWSAVLKATRAVYS